MLKKYNEDWGSLDSYSERGGAKDRFKEQEVVGLPSGQVIYMNQKQIDYFEARKYITWRANVNIGGTRIKLTSYTFEDDNLDEIKEKMDLISW